MERKAYVEQSSFSLQAILSDLTDLEVDFCMCRCQLLGGLSLHLNHLIA